MWRIRVSFRIFQLTKAGPNGFKEEELALLRMEVPVAKNIVEDAVEVMRLLEEELELMGLQLKESEERLDHFMPDDGNFRKILHNGYMVDVNIRHEAFLKLLTVLPMDV